MFSLLFNTHLSLWLGIPGERSWNCLLGDTTCLPSWKTFKPVLAEMCSECCWGTFCILLLCFVRWSGSKVLSLLTFFWRCHRNMGEVTLEMRLHITLWILVWSPHRHLQTYSWLQYAQVRSSCCKHYSVGLFQCILLKPHKGTKSSGFHCADCNQNDQFQLRVVCNI